MFQRGKAIVHCPRLRRYGYALRAQHRSAAALRAKVVYIRRQAIADVDHRMERSGGVQGQRLAHARREIEVLAENAAAERAGDEEPVARPRAVATHGTALGRLTDDSH